MRGTVELEAVARPTGTVTFLLTDIEGSTRNWETSPVQMRAALARHDALLNSLIATHSGRVLTERGEGDSFFAVIERLSEHAKLIELFVGESKPWLHFRVEPALMTERDRHVK